MFRKKHSFIVAVVTVVSFKVLTFLYGIEQVSIECFTSLCDWFRKLAQLSQPIRCKTKTNHDLVARVFPRFRQFGFCFEFSLALKGIFLSSYWLLWLFRFGFTTLNRKALCFQFSEIVVDFSWIGVTVFHFEFFFSAIFVLYYLFFVSLVSVVLLLQLNLTNLHHSFQFVVSLKPFFQWDWRF